MTCWPDLFPGYWIARNADILSLRMIADFTRVPVTVIADAVRAISFMMLTAYKIPISSAACTYHRSVGPI
jgi:hypothetical protein